jgi:hypothetical protein
MFMVQSFCNNKLQMRTLSKTKLLAYLQCPKRLWLEIHKKDLRADSLATEAGFVEGNKVGDMARQIYDPERTGELIDVRVLGFTAAFARSSELLASAVPIFEAGFSAEGGLAFADVMLPVREAGQRAWRMVEVKSSTQVKDYHRDDIAIQAFIARSAGVQLSGIALAHIDSSWVYPGGGDYQGLLLENDLTEEAFGRAEEVQTWIAGAQVIANKRKEPLRATGSHCDQPYACGFLAHCQGQEPQAQYPVHWLPRIQTKALKEHIEEEGAGDLRHVPDGLLSDRQLRVKKHTLSNKVFFDGAGAAADMAPHKLPAYFLDFETIQFAVPIWQGTRPYQQIPFQFSVHRLGRTGKLDQQSFLDLSGEDPSRRFAQALIAQCGKQGPVFVYNAGFETARIRELAQRFPELAPSLLAINERVVDLLRVAEQRYYHPSQQGSWSIKKVLPAVAPDLRYSDLEGVQDGGMAMKAFLEAIAAVTTGIRKTQIEKQLLDYCGLDTYAMVRLWAFFSGRAGFVK